MNLSLDFIAEKLKGRFGVAIRCGATNSAASSFSSVRIFDRTQHEHAHIKPLVIASPSSCQVDDLEGCEGVIWLGDEEPPFDIPSIWLSGADDPMCVLDEVLDIMEDHARWCEGIRTALLDRTPIEDVVKRLSDVTSSPFWYADATLRPLFMSENERLEQLSPIWCYQKEHGRFSSETLSALISSGDYERINGSGEAWLFDNNDTFEGPFVAKAIICNGTIYGYLFAIQIDEDSSTCDIELLETLGNLIGSYIEHSGITTPASNRLADQMLKERLLESPTHESELTDLANLLHWNLRDRFVVAVFETNRAERTGKDILRAQMDMLEDNLLGRAIQIESRVALVIDTTQSRDFALEDSLASFCRKSAWKAGLSNRFEGLEHMNSYYQQAKSALRIGLVENPDCLVHPFNDYAVFSICEQLSKQVSEPLLVHPDVRRIAKHDEQGGGNLLETLEAHLDNERNVAKTAQALFLHRNSISYRIEKIHSIMKTDLDDNENRLSIILSLKIWRYLHRTTR